MSQSTGLDTTRLHKIWADADGVVHKCEWLKVGDRKVPVAVTLCGQQTPQADEHLGSSEITCQACAGEIADRQARLIQA